MKLLAQSGIQIAPNGGYAGFGTLGKPEGNGIPLFASFLSTAIGIMTVIAFIWFAFLFIIGAFKVMTAGGDKQKLEDGRKQIVNGIIGVGVIISAVFVISVFGYIFGVNFLDLTTLLNNISKSR